MTTNDFDLDFDFEKEYGIDPPEEEPAPQSIEDEFDLRAILDSNFEDAGLFASEYESNFDYGPDEFSEEAPAQEEAPQIPEEPEIPMDDSIDGLTAADFELPAEEPEDEPQPEEEPEKPLRQRRPRPEPSQKPKEENAEQQSAPRRKKPVSKMRQFKNDLLPRIIAGCAALLILIFVIGSISRAIKTNREEKDALKSSSEAAKSKAELEAEQVQTVLAEADELATGYDYDGAIEKLNAFAASFTGDKTKYPEIDNKLSAYNQAKSQLVAHNDPGAIPNLSFQVLIADPEQAFSDQNFGGQYNKNFVTTDEFQKILEQLYANNFVLVEMDSFIAETDTNGTITYSSKPLYLPDGKKPVMITETMVNYYNYMIESGGFASRLVLQNGEIKAEMTTSSGETLVGNYDLVPILEDFIEAHPDFSYQGARATLAVTGEEGVFGYRTNTSVITSQSQEYYDGQVAEAKQIASALRAAGYEIACYTYANKNYGNSSASEIQADLANWAQEVTPVLGTVDTLVYAKSSDISTTGDYTGGKYNVLSQAGFRYFITSGNTPSAKVTNDYVRQVRLMVTGSNMYHAASMYSSYFDAKSVLNSLRGDVPQ